MTKPRPPKLGNGNHWNHAEDEQLRSVMREVNGFPPGKGSNKRHFWGKIASRLGLGAAPSAQRRVRRRWAMLAPNAPNARKVADLQLEHAKEACGADASPRDVLDPLPTMVEDNILTTFIDQALSASRGAEIDKLKELVGTD